MKQNLIQRSEQNYNQQDRRKYEVNESVTIQKQSPFTVIQCIGCDEMRLINENSQCATDEKCTGIKN